MTRLGIPQVRIAQRLKRNRKAIVHYAAQNQDLFNKIHQDLKNGVSIPDTARTYGVPQALVWSVALQEKTDQERFKQMNWGLQTWDHWYFNDVDHRFGDDWPGRIPAQLVAHTLFYFTRQDDLVFDPMAGGGVVPDLCLAFNRRCWSFDLLDRPNTKPEIEPFDRLSSVNGTVFSTYGQAHAEQKNPGCCQKNIDHGEMHLKKKRLSFSLARPWSPVFHYFLLFFFGNVLHIGLILQV